MSGSSDKGGAENAPHKSVISPRIISQRDCTYVRHELKSHHDVCIALGDAQDVDVAMSHVHEAAGPQHSDRGEVRDVVSLSRVEDVRPEGCC